MKVLIDDKIPYIRSAAQWLLGDVDYLPGHAFGGSRQLAETDALIIRTRTHCDEALLASAHRLRFIATATIGHDHIDADYLRRRGIAWTNCPGCNAASVAQYVRNSLLKTSFRLLENSEQRTENSSENKEKQSVHAPLTVGIVGYGHVGRAVRRAVEAIGCRVLLNDPPLEEAIRTQLRRGSISHLTLEESPSMEGVVSPEGEIEGASGASESSGVSSPSTTFVTLQEIAEQSDVITFHTPLTTGGSHPTLHLADSAFFASLRRRPVIINAARGGVVDEQALLRAHRDGLVGPMLIDTWEGAPSINPHLLREAFIATPHIAGYSADGKSCATRMALRAVCRHFGIPIDDEARFLALTAPPSLPPEVQPSGRWADDALTLYDPLLDTARLKASPATFEQQRGSYPLRRETFE